MSLPDELNTEIQQYQKDSETTIQDITLRGIIAGIPFVGGLIAEIFNGLAQQRQQERLNNVFDALRNRLHELGQEKIDRSVFKSEEFQTFLFLLLERLQTTHDAEKLRQFGNALSNAGSLEFSDDAKEDYIRILRDLSRRDLTTLDDFGLKGWTPHTREIHYSADVLVSLSRLQGMGLVIGNLKPKSVNQVSNSPTEIAQIISDMISQPPPIQYSLSTLGERFLRFVQAEGSAESPTM